MPVHIHAHATCRMPHAHAHVQAVHAERWSWVVVSRAPGELRTYVNGRLCASVKLEATKMKGKAAEKEKDEWDKADGAAGGTDAGGAPSGAKPEIHEKFKVDPSFLALFPSGDEGSEQGGAVRGLAVKYIRVTSKCWSASDIAEELHKVRSADEEAELRESAESSRAQQLALQPLYAKPPPIWLHPAFAAECADPFIAGTPFES